MTDAKALRTQANRYRQMRDGIDDPKTKTVLAALADEFDAKADAAERRSPIQQQQADPKK